MLPVCGRRLFAGDVGQPCEQGKGILGVERRPGSHAGGLTTFAVTCYGVLGPGEHLAPFETFTLQRPRQDTHHH